MSILKISSKTHLDNNFLEGIVSSVDVERMFCQVKTTKGQNLSNVIWLLPAGGSSRSNHIVTPMIGDRVLITTSTGYPIIIGFLPKILETESIPTKIDTGQLPSDTGNFSPVMRNAEVAPNKPKDTTIGDHIITSKGGGLLGVLRGGSILLKSGRLAQVFISKYDDIVRVVGRNYELFSDLVVDIHVSIRGRIYGFLGVADTLANSRLGLFKFKRYLGDTALGEYLKDEYQNRNSSEFPAPNTIIKKEVLSDNSHNPLMVDTLDLSGESKKIVQGIPGSEEITITDQLKTQHKTTSTSGTAIGTVDITPTSVTIRNEDGTMSDAVFTKDSVTITYNNTTVVVLDATGMNCTFGGHFVKMDSSGIHLG